MRDVTVDLADFTILIGPNDSGKSSFLEVIQTFGKLVTQGYAGTFKDDRSLANLVWGRDSGLHIGLELEGTTLNHRFVYGLEIPVDARPPCETLKWDGAKVLWTEEPRLARASHKSKPYRPAHSWLSSLRARGGSKVVFSFSAE